MKKSKLFLLSTLALLMPIASCDFGNESSIAQQAIDDAADYLKTLYIEAPQATTADYQVTSSFELAGVTYNVEWRIEIGEGGDQNAVSLGDVVDGLQTIKVVYNEDTSSKTDYKLIATIKNGELNSEISFKHNVPIYKFATLAEFKAAADASSKEDLTVRGKVISVYKSGLYLQNSDGECFYAYSPEGNDWKKIAIGTDIQVTGSATKYNNQYEFNSKCKVSVKNAAEAGFKVNYQDVTSVFTAAAKVTNEATLMQYVNFPVEIKGVKVGQKDVTSGYYYFSIGENKSYLRPSTSWINISTGANFTEAETLAMGNDWVPGYTADIKGIAQLYNNLFYIAPIETTPVTITDRTLTPALKVENALNDIASLFGEKTSGSSITLPEHPESEYYNTVTYSYSLPVDVDATKFAIENGKLTYVMPESGKYETDVTVTATLDSETQSKTFKLTILEPVPTPIADILSGGITGEDVYIKGIVTAVNSNDPTKADSFIITDAAGNSIFSYEKFAVALGDEILIKGQYTENYSFPQFKTSAVTKVLSHNNDLATACSQKLTYAGEELKTALDACKTSADLISGFTGKLIEYTGYVVKRDSYYDIAPTADGTGVLRTYYNKDIDLSCYLGKKVLVKGFTRSTFLASKEGESNSLTIQFQSCELVEEADLAIRKQISITTPENGTVAAADSTLDLTTLPLGKVVKFVATASDGYKVKEVKVNGETVSVSKTGEFLVGVKDDMTIVATFEEIVAGVSCDFSSKSSSHSSYGDLWTYGAEGDAKFNVFGGGNNSAGWDFIKLGAKSANLANANPAYIETQDAISKQVSKVTIKYAAGSFSKAGMAVTSVKVYVYTGTWESTTAANIVDTIVSSYTITSAAGQDELVPTSGTTWAANCKFRVEYTLENSTTSNGIVCVSSITFTTVD